MKIGLAVAEMASGEPAVVKYDFESPIGESHGSRIATAPFGRAAGLRGYPDPNHEVICVEGIPGSGKSSLIAKLVAGTPFLSGFTEDVTGWQCVPFSPYGPKTPGHAG